VSYLTKPQVDQLLWPIRPERVSKREGMSHLEAYDVRAHLNRIFGFARWSGEVLSMDLCFEQVFEQVAVTNAKGEKRWVVSDTGATGATGEKRWVVSVGYRALYRLTIKSPDGVRLAPYTESAAGDAVNFPINKRGDAHDFAIKTAESQALKRCATNLGDQFGLSLYNGGSVKPLVAKTMYYPFEAEKKEPAEDQSKTDEQDVSAHVTSLAPERPEPDERESARITQQARPNGSTPDEPPADVPPDEPDAFPNDSLRRRILAAGDPRELLALKTEAVRAGVHKELTANRDGVPVTIGALVDAEIQAKSRRTA